MSEKDALERLAKLEGYCLALEAEIRVLKGLATPVVAAGQMLVHANVKSGGPCYLAALELKARLSC